MIYSNDAYYENILIPILTYIESQNGFGWKGP